MQEIAVLKRVLYEGRFRGGGFPKNRREITKMKSLALQDANRIQFDYIMKCVIDSAVKDYYRQLETDYEEEVPFADISQTSLNQIGSVDKYEIETIGVEIGDIAKVNISHEQLAEALHRVSARKRETVLLFYYLKASDEEIAEALKIDPSTSYRNRKKALAEIRKMLQEE